MRLYRVTIADVERIVANPAQTGQDARGNTSLDGLIGGRRVRVVVASDDSDFVTTVPERGA